MNSRLKTTQRRRNSCTFFPHSSVLSVELCRHFPCQTCRTKPKKSETDQNMTAPFTFKHGDLETYLPLGSSLDVPCALMYPRCATPRGQPRAAWLRALLEVLGVIYDTTGRRLSHFSHIYRVRASILANIRETLVSRFLQKYSEFPDLGVILFLVFYMAKPIIWSKFLNFLLRVARWVMVGRQKKWKV